MSDPRQPPDAAPRLELRIERGRVRIGLSPGPIAPGLALVDLEMEPAAFPGPFDPGAGTAPFRSVPCALRRLVVAAEGTPPGADALASVLAAALGPSGWPAPDASGLVHAPAPDGARATVSWLLPADALSSALRAAREGAARGEAGAALRLAEAGHAALAAGEAAAGQAALREALSLGLGRDDAREAWGALVAAARAAGNPADERTALAGLASAAPTGERPALLLRLSALDLEAGDPAAARLHAEDARRLAPRDPVATEACLAAARRDGDVAETVDLLDRMAVLDPASAGDRLLERARLLAAAGRLVEADAGYVEALSRLPARRALADEHAAFRKGAPPPVGRLPWGEPLETLAGREADAVEAARALRDAALLAREQGDGASALRAARRAHERAGDVAFAGELLAGLLHAGGSVTEALEVHRRLLAEAGPSLSPEALADRLTAQAELAEEAGDLPLATGTLDQLLGLRPHDAALLEWRFRVDPDRAGALDRLAAGAAELHSRRARALLLATASGAARAEGGDPARERALLRQAADAAVGSPAAEREVARRLLSLCRASPADEEGARILESVLDRDPGARAEAFLSLAEAAAPGRVRASHLQVAAAALA
ncbi:MAG TPA: hypothetical protein VFM45_10540, partial [Anaeromyxobacteraceae bacterium]|nr:hypothetical protein [Anaeromyxobacteraceae bacterium]